MGRLSSRRHMGIWLKSREYPCHVKSIFPRRNPWVLPHPSMAGGLMMFRCDGAECGTRVVNPNWWQDIISNGAVIPSSIWCQSVFASYLIEYDNEYHLCENMTLRRLVCEIIGQPQRRGRLSQVRTCTTLYTGYYMCITWHKSSRLQYMCLTLS